MMALFIDDHREAYGIEPSAGSVRDYYDNALAESTIGLYKAELIRQRGPWPNLEAVEFAMLEWVDRFNHCWLLEPIGHVPPAEMEARYYARAHASAMAATLKQAGLQKSQRGSLALHGPLREAHIRALDDYLDSS
jgi:hypothetical protein